MNDTFYFIKYLFKINNLLSIRTRSKSPFLYFLIIVVFCVIICTVLTLGLFSYLDISNMPDKYKFIASVLFLIIIIDIMLSMIRFQYTATIEPLHLIVFPISSLKIYFLNLLIFITDYKSFIYLIPLLVFLSYLIINSHFTAILFTIPLFLLFTISINLYLFLIYILIYGLLNKVRNSSIVIPIMLIALYNIIIASDSLKAFTYIPFVSIPSTGFLHLINGEYINVIINTGYMTLIIIIGILIFIRLSKYEFAKYIRPL